ncbi:MAG: ArsR/SmtB family transcription factor, partial [Desulfatiglandales bacterium]
DPNRLKILKLLEERSMCVCELTEALKISQPAVSKHLRTLEHCGLVGFKKEGLWVIYFLKEDSLDTRAARLLEELMGWLDGEPEILNLKASSLLINRENIKGRQNRNGCRC